MLIGYLSPPRKNVITTHPAVGTGRGWLRRSKVSANLPNKKKTWCWWALSSSGRKMGNPVQFTWLTTCTVQDFLQWQFSLMSNIQNSDNVGCEAVSSKRWILAPKRAYLHLSLPSNSPKATRSYRRIRLSSKMGGDQQKIHKNGL